MLKILQARLQQYMNRELSDIQAGFRKGRGTSDQIANISWIIEISREFQKSIYFCFTLTTLFLLSFTFSTLTTLKPLDMWITTMENSSRDGNTRPPYLSPAKPVFKSRSNSWNQTWNNRLVPNWEREYIKAVYCHLAYWTYMQSISREIPGWMNHKLESRLLGEISTTSDMQMTSPLWQKAKRTKEPLDESERG